MMGCLRRLGCLVFAVMALALAAGWYWYRYKRPATRATADATTSPAAGSTWQPMTKDGAARARGALQKLGGKSGPVFVNVAPGDLASYIVEELSQSLPASADSIEAAAIGDRLMLRARVRTSELGGSASLGPLSMLLGDRERIQMGGTLKILKPGRAELRVQEIRIHDLNLPGALIRRLISQISRGPRPPDISPNGIPLQTPMYVGDVRVSDGKITLYKNVGQ